MVGTLSNLLKLLSIKVLKNKDKILLGVITRCRRLIKKNTNKLVFIHIGKCGGTYVYSGLPNIIKIHMKKPDIQDDASYIIWIRNPIKRFVSAFNHSLAIINYDVKGRDFDSLIKDQDTPYHRLPNKIKNKLGSNHPFNEWTSGVEYESLIQYFKSPNNLAESLSSENNDVRAKAITLMGNIEVEHISKGIGWYLDNGEFIKKNHANILFVGKQDNMEEDMALLYDKLNLNIAVNTNKRREQKFVSDKSLSLLAIKNVKNFYKDTDYKALSVLKSYGFISTNTYNSYLRYEI